MTAANLMSIIAALITLAGAWARPALAPATVPTPGAAETDPVLAAMSAEMQRSKAGLRMDQVDPPYYIEYCVTDVDEYAGEAEFGAFRGDARRRQRLLHAIVRIGDYRRDSFTGMGISAEMPLDDDPLALRHQIWAATDRAYKTAAEMLAAKTSALKQLASEDPVDDFSRQAPAQRIGPLARLEFDQAQWHRALQSASSLPAGSSGMLSLRVQARFLAVNRYFVNSEGTVLRSGSAKYVVTMLGALQADDGMMLQRSPVIFVTDPRELPMPDQLNTQVKEMAVSLTQLKNAPAITEEYHGPVLFLPDASNDIFADLIANAIPGNRPRPGAPGRTTGSFANSYRGRVLPEFLTVVDDPTAREFDGQSLAGYFDIDDEGVKAEPVTVIEKGTLVNYLLGRTPLRDFPASNGHGRRGINGGPASPGTSNLFVRPSTAASREDLKKKLLELCRDRGLSYGYVVATLAGVRTPRMIYRLYVQDGREELVRGTALDQLDTRALREIVAVGNDAFVSNRPETMMTSVICPSVLFQELGVQPAPQAKTKLPDYPPPRK